MPIVSVKKLEDADIDCGTLEEVINGEPNKRIKTRLGREVWTLASVPLLSVYTIDETEALIDKEQNRAKNAEVELRNSKASKQELEYGLSPKADKVYVDQLVIDAQNNIQNFKTEVELLAFTPGIENYTGKALDTKKVWLWDGIQWNDTGLSELDLAKDYTNELINPNLVDIIRDKNGFVIAELAGNLFNFFTHFKARSINTEHFSAQDDGTTQLKVRDGFGFYGDLSELLKPKTQRKDIDVQQPLFTKKLAYWSNEPFKLNVACLLKDKVSQVLNKHVLASMASTQTEFESTSDQDIYFPKFEQLGSEAILILRDKQNELQRSRLTLSCIQVPDAIENQETKVHVIGDSISNRGGLYYTQQYLNKHGYSATFIGTMLASDASNSASSNGTYLGECREGWETGDFTYQITNRVNLVAAGEEAIYQAYDKSMKWTHNPYLRLATESDDSNIVRNGYVFDFQFYLSRFGLDTPEVVTIGLGTNDIRDLDEPTLSIDFYSNMKLMINQIMKVSSNIKIVLFIPGTSYEATRNLHWITEYVPVIQQLQKLSNEFANVILMPAWTINSQEASYTFTANDTDSISGAGYGTFSDSIHPIQASRFQIFNYLAANIVAVKSM